MNLAHFMFLVGKCIEQAWPKIMTWAKSRSKRNNHTDNRIVIFLKRFNLDQSLTF